MNSKKQVDEVVLTDTAKSKCHRYISQPKLKEKVENRLKNGEYRKIDDDHYWFFTKTKKRFLDNYQNLVVVFNLKEQQGDLVAVVITQKSKQHRNDG